MKVFHHGGRIGDCIFALYTMKKMGGGHLILTDYHHPNWDLKVAESIRSFLLYQPYVSGVTLSPYSCLKDTHVDYDFQKAEDDYNPDVFPEWDGQDWPGSCHIAKRYAVHFGIEFKGEPWLLAPYNPENGMIAVHRPGYRMVRPLDAWDALVFDLGCFYSIAETGRNWNLLNTARDIYSARVFLGTVSCGNAIAEGLGKRRVVEHAADCWNVTPDIIINNKPNEEVMEIVRNLIKD